MLTDFTAKTTVHGLREDPVRFLTDLVRARGDLVRLPFDGPELFILNHPEYIGRIFTTHGAVFRKRKDEAAENAYLKQIAGFVPMFASHRLPRYAAVMVGAATRANDRWRARYRAEGPFEVDAYREMMRITLDVAVRTLFNADADPEAAEIVDAILELDSGYGYNPIESTLGEFMPPVPPTVTPGGDAARERIAAFVRRLVAGEVGFPHAPPIFLTMLAGSMPPEQAVAVAMSVLLAMHEVTATTLSWAWHVLGQEPAVAEKLRAELVAVLEGAPPSIEDLPHAPYLEMVLAETRRLYPSVWIVGRFLREAVELDGVVLPAGSVALASQQVTHRDPRFFPVPDRFDPERWTPESQAMRPAVAYFPFSFGPRACAGASFAALQDGLVLGLLAQHWRATPVMGQQPEAAPRQSNAPRPGIRMRLEPAAPKGS